MAKQQTGRKSAARKPKAGTGRKWSAEVTETSDAMTLEKDVFKSRSPKRIAQSVKRSAERSHRRKSSPFRSAMSMLTLLYQPRRQKLVGVAQARAGGGEEPAAPSLPSPGRRLASQRDRSVRHGALRNARFARFAPIR